MKMPMFNMIYDVDRLKHHEAKKIMDEKFG